MPRIQQLPPSVVTKIAAGEVIERPASVLKELLENSIDAGSRRIDVEVEQGGLGLIRVADDGGGIAAEDLPLAFASHATSKLRSADDLFRVGTFGFRGEALASVGGVAQVTLQSRPPDRDCGAEVSCHGGALSGPRPWGGPAGTRIEVRHLFYNTPVRRKFLRGPGVEMGHIAEVFLRLALSPRAPHLTLRHNGKAVHDVPVHADLLDRIALFFGTDLGQQLYPVEAEASQGAVRLEGYVADPACERGRLGAALLVRQRPLGARPAAVAGAARGVPRPADGGPPPGGLPLPGAAPRPGRCQRPPHQGRGPLPRQRRPRRPGAAGGSRPAAGRGPDRPAPAPCRPAAGQCRPGDG
jgi:DNA mismatch repair protein MutL